MLRSKSHIWLGIGVSRYTRHFYSVYSAILCYISALCLLEIPLAEGISASDLEGMQGTVHNA